jgi:two-component system cell cycle response regulator DivK
MARELILIVEDNEMNRKLLRDVLGFLGHEVLECTTAEDGLALARDRRPALILMDIQLPGMDGVAAVRELRRDPAIRSIPVVAVTASAMPTQRNEIVAAGFDGYLTKPLNVKKFIAEVQRLLDGAAVPARDPDHGG